jgi:hypothetical protein
VSQRSAVAPAGAVIGFRYWSLVDGALCSPYSSSCSWRERTMRAACVPAVGRTRLLRPHRSPHPDCVCGIWCWLDFADVRVGWVDPEVGAEIKGIVALWGAVERDGATARGELARVCALGVPPALSPRHASALRERALLLRADLVREEDLEAVAPRYGSTPRI